jgi:hypothetical protein
VPLTLAIVFVILLNARLTLAIARLTLAIVFVTLLNARLTLAITSLTLAIAPLTLAIVSVTLPIAHSISVAIAPPDENRTHYG